MMERDAFIISEWGVSVMANKRAKGQPARYTEPEKMQTVIDEYFKRCAGRYLTDQEGCIALDKKGRPILVDAHPPTIMGLTLALGFATPKSLSDYQKKPLFRETVTIAKSRVEQYAEENLFNPNAVVGAKFTLLCNFGWTAAECSAGSEATRVRIINAGTALSADR